MSAWLFLIPIPVLVVGLALGRGYAAWVASGALALGAWLAVGVTSGAWFAAAALLLAVLALVFGVPALRRRVVSAWVMKILGRQLPRMSETEKIALDAGTTWWESTVFAGAPDWQGLFDMNIGDLSPRERAFLNGPVEELCAMLDEWRIAKIGDLPPRAWKFLKTHKFFGMVIPEEYGGLGFSAQAHSAVVMKIASRSTTGAITVMVPNSLGPAELLLHYGTDEQKRRLLPRLASGEEIPCFALTGPEAGSDAAATQSFGIVCRGEYDGREVLGMRLTWRKRYITLAPVATLIGLAFQLRDPDGLLGDRKERGMTCALVPSHLPGIRIGERHDPLGVAFQNGPTTGDDVFVPLDFIIGGPAMAGEGWRMLMESLSVGRSISLPALSVGAAKLATRTAAAYGVVRKQFDMPIGRFEGVEERLARMAGRTYLMDAARRLTLAAVDAGERPSVVSAIVKASLTEMMRMLVNDAMDVRAGAAICRGPRNILADAYAAAPIGITVEGANILTRSLIIFGQGSVRCHPFVQDQMRAIADGDLARFDRAFFGHVGHVARNAVAMLLPAAGAPAPKDAHARRAVRRTTRAFSRASRRFALLADATLATLGGSLKRRETLSGRMADAFSWIYLGAATLKRFVDESRGPGGRGDADLPLMRWACEHALWQTEQALTGVLDNLPNRPVAWLLRALLFPFGARRRPPSDALGAAVARDLLEHDDVRENITAGIYIPGPNEPGLGELEAVRRKVAAIEPIERKIKEAVRAGRIERRPKETIVNRAVREGVITESEWGQVVSAEMARDDVIQVDSFDPKQYATARR